MRLVIVESPYAGEIDANTAYAREALADALHRGEAPLASHLLYTQPGVLRDDVPGERTLGIAAGLAWGRFADATVVYTDRGLSPGMVEGIRRAVEEGRPVEFRTLPDWNTRPTTPPPLAHLPEATPWAGASSFPGSVSRIPRPRRRPLHDKQRPQPRRPA